MRVLFVGHTYTVGINRDKIDLLSRRPDVELTLIVPRRWPHTLRIFHVDPSTSKTYRLRALDTLFEGRETRYVYFPEMTMGIQNLRPDIIHVEQGPWALVHSQALLAKRVFAPWAKTIFFTWWNVEYKLSPLGRAIEWYNFRNSDWAIAGNQDAAWLLERHGFRKGISVLPQLGVDPDTYRRLGVNDLQTQLGLEGCFVVGFVGRLKQQKGLDTLLEAFARLDNDPHLVLVGKGDFQPTLLQRAAELNIDHRLHIPGVVSHREVVRYLNIFDVLVLPSRTTPHWKEQFGHVLIEAMACETPVIGSDSGEIPNVIGDAGLIFPEGDVEALADAIGRLMRDEDLRRDLAHRGRERVLQHYTHQRIAEETVAIWRELLQE